MSQIQYSELDNKLIDKDYIIGADECGTGCIAGPLVVCGVKAPKQWTLSGLNDSKKLSEKKRDAMRLKLNELIQKNEIQFHIAERSNNHIDKYGVAVSLKDAYVEVFNKLYASECLIIADGTLKFDNLIPDDYSIVSLIKADQQVPAVMAASILGKTFRDAKMKELAILHPQYDWQSNMGYGSSKHLVAIETHGPCSLHRFSYAPMKNMTNKTDERQLLLFKE